MSKTLRKVPRHSSLADTLFSATQQKVLGHLFGQPDRSFYATGLIAAVGGGSGAVQRELGRLEACGLISSTRIGNQKHYQANRQSPIFEELAGIFRYITAPAAYAPAMPAMLKAAEPAVVYAGRADQKRLAPVLKRVGVSRARLAGFCRAHGIRKLSFFGSVTRADFRPDSDVDVKAEFAPGRVPGLEIVDIKDELSQLFGGRPVDLLTSPEIRNPYRRRSIERDLLVAYTS